MTCSKKGSVRCMSCVECLDVGTCIVFDCQKSHSCVGCENCHIETSKMTTLALWGIPA